MLRLAGTPVHDQDVRDLIATLVADGGSDTVDAAQQIGRTMAQGQTVVPLTTARLDAILSVLEGPSEGLIELRGALARDHANRLG